MQLSIAYPYYNARVKDRDPTVAVTQDRGADMVNFIKSAAQYGFCTETLFPTDDQDVLRQGPPPGACTDGKKRRIIAAASGPCTLDVLKACLFARTPPMAGTFVFPEFDDAANYAAGVVPVPTAAQVEDVKAGRYPQAHEVVLTAVDEVKKLVRFQNSDGANYGQAGFGWLPFQFLFDEAFTLGPLYVIQKIGVR